MSIAGTLKGNNPSVALGIHAALRLVVCAVQMPSHGNMVVIGRQRAKLDQGLLHQFCGGIVRKLPCRLTVESESKRP